MPDTVSQAIIRRMGDPYAYSAAVTASDTVDLTNWTRALLVTVTGNLVVDLVGSGQITFTGLAANTILPFRVKRVKATGTTATVVALW